MSRSWNWWLAWGSWAFTAACGIASAVLISSTEQHELGDPSTYGPSVAAAFVAFQSFATVGALIASRRPENAIGWLFCAAAAMCQWANTIGAFSFFAHERGWPGVAWLAVAFAPAWVIGVTLVPIFAFQLFPDGRPLSRRWRWPLWLGAGAIVAMSVASILTPGQLEGIPDGYVNPIGIPGMDIVAGATWVFALVLIFASVGSLVARFRRSRGIERQQIKIFAGCACFVVLALVGFSLLHELTHVLDFIGPYTDVVWLLMLSLIPASVGVAILRYRLYDIDRVISRALVYGSLTVLLGTAYVGMVLFGQWVFSSVAGGSDLTVAVSTLVVAALFLPMRSRLQRLVDRRFYRSRYDAQQTLEAFGGRLREQVDLESLRAELRGVVEETMQPTHASLWLRSGARG